MRRRKVLGAIALLVFILLVGLPLLLVGVILANGAPLWPEPGPFARMGRYLTENHIDTRDPFFPEVSPIPLSSSPEEAFDRVGGVVEGLGWEVVESSSEELTLHATEKTSFWKFVDDIHIEVSGSEGEESVVHVRSESRVGRGDLGVNLGRFLHLRKALEKTE